MEKGVKFDPSMFLKRETWEKGEEEREFEAMITTIMHEDGSSILVRWRAAQLQDSGGFSSNTPAQGLIGSSSDSRIREDAWISYFVRAAMVWN
jgi:hypothetical protein